MTFGEGVLVGDGEVEEVVMVMLRGLGTGLFVVDQFGCGLRGLTVCYWAS